MSRPFNGLFEAARWAASSSNEQPWAFLVAMRQDPKNFEALAGVLVESQQREIARRVRKPLDTFMFPGASGNAAPLLYSS